MKLLFKIIFFIFLTSSQLYASEASKWLKTEIDFILEAYSNTDVSNENRFLIIENTINYNFAGKGIAKFISGKAWKDASKETKEKYIKFFKKHLALNVASIMQGYVNQEYSLIDSKYDSKNKVSLVDMIISTNSSNITITWRVKQSKERFYIIDLLVADISLVVTKRSEFNSMLKNVNYNLDIFSELLNKQNEESYNILIN
jgi:phospholipid transport system substrate-binding protein